MHADFNAKEINVQVGVLGPGIATDVVQDAVEGASIGEYRTLVRICGHDLSSLDRSPFLPDGFLFVVEPGETRDRLDKFTDWMKITWPGGDAPPAIIIGPAPEGSFPGVDSIQEGMESLMPLVWKRVQSFHEEQIANPPKAGPPDPGF